MFVPTGQPDNSPAFQRRVIVGIGMSPTGTAEIHFHKYRSSSALRCFFQPSLRDFGNSEFIPALKCRAIVIASLRDGQMLIAPVVHPKMVSGNGLLPNPPSE
jgi:hypothetical protein